MDGQLLKRLRNRKRWSLRKTAAAAGVPVSTYRGWEEGRKVPSRMLPKIADAHGISMADLLGAGDRRSANVVKAIYYVEEVLELLRQSLTD